MAIVSSDGVASCTFTIDVNYTDFTITSSNRTKIGFTGAEGENLVIPATFQDTDGTWYKVISIGKNAFKGCTGLTGELVIPDSVTSIDHSVFLRCSSLTDIVIPDSVTSIGQMAFYMCSGLTNVYYTGTEEQWAAITIGTYNEKLTNATITYNYTAN